MKKTLSFLTLIFALAQLQAQNINQVVIDPNIDREILIGEINESGLQNTIFVDTWQNQLDNYSPDKHTVKKLKKIIRKNKNLSVKVFFASWCGDSKEHLPNFVKLVHQIKLDQVSYYALNRQMIMDEYDFIDVFSFNVERVPTFIIYQNDTEIGRIIETPTVSLEKDLLKILKGKK